MMCKVLLLCDVFFLRLTWCKHKLCPAAAKQSDGPKIAGLRNEVGFFEMIVRLQIWTDFDAVWTANQIIDWSFWISMRKLGRICRERGIDERSW